VNLALDKKRERVHRQVKAALAPNVAHPPPPEKIARKSTGGNPPPPAIPEREPAPPDLAALEPDAPWLGPEKPPVFDESPAAVLQRRYGGDPPIPPTRYA